MIWFPSLSLAFFVPALLFAQYDAGRVAPPEHRIRVVAFGDFGTGSPMQKRVAEAIQRSHGEEPFDLGLTMGDNFYRCGVRSIRDVKWKTRWEDLYSPLGIPFFATLGNHDYGHPPLICPQGRGSPEAEIAYSELSPSWRMPAKYYTFTAGSVRFIAIDTEGWSLQQLDWIKKTLAESAEEPGIRWRIVYGHHPIHTSGVHINERKIRVLRAQLLPVLIQAGVDFYVCGHDHDLEHLRADGIDFLIAGGGGAHIRSLGRREPESLFGRTEYAFLELTASGNDLVARFLNTDLQPLEPAPVRRTK